MSYSFQIYLTSFLILCGMSTSLSGIEANNRSFKCDYTILKDTTQIKIFIEGMSCMRCVQKIEKKVSSIDGLKKVKVYLEKKYAIIVFDNKITTIEELIAKIKDAGYMVDNHEIIKIKRG